MFFEGPLLAIETSCDETSAAVLRGSHVVSNVVASQTDLHRKWGGIVPEAAARAHVEALLPVVREALSMAGVSLDECRAIAVTNRPGLVGALSVGVTGAKAFALALEVPLIGVHHLEGHILSPFAEAAPPFPHVALVVSGGHTEIVLVRDMGDYAILGETRDDAAGEAFDKSARLLGLGYPGGPAIQRAAEGGTARYKLPHGLSGDTTDFSFSGFKTAVARLVQQEGDRLSVPDAAASVQSAIVDVLVERGLRAADRVEGVRALTLVGGVAANGLLRRRLAEECERAGLGFFTPSPLLCTDNAGMIGLAGSFRLAKGERDDYDLDVASSAPLPGLRPHPL